MGCPPMTVHLSRLFVPPGVAGTVIEVVAPRRLVVTWQVLYDPELSDEQSRVTYEIEKRGHWPRVRTKLSSLASLANGG